MCAGDGTCTGGLLEVTNAEAYDVTFRTHSASCPATALGVDMWGTSKEQVVPDILNASGMCSYR